MSDEIKKTVLNTLVEPIANSAKNITDKPTQNIGTTFADIWYLVFGGISQAAEKRKLKYSYALQEFENELKEKISKIPKDKLVDPDIQIIAKALEESKYCIDKEELRHMFSSLIAASLNTGFSISPALINIISLLTPINARTLNFYYLYDKKIQTELNHINELLHSSSNADTTNYALNKAKELAKIHINIVELEQYLNIPKDDVTNSIRELEHLNLICHTSDKIENPSYIYQTINGDFIAFENARLSLLGVRICQICLD